MSFETVVTAETAFLHIAAIGVFSTKDMVKFVDHAFLECETREAEKVLLDCSRIVGEMSEADRFRGGQYYAELFGPLIKGAIVLAAGQVTKLGELAARNRGADLLVTDSITEAVDWLISG